MERAWSTMLGAFLLLRKEGRKGGRGARGHAPDSGRAGPVTALGHARGSERLRNVLKFTA